MRKKILHFEHGHSLKAVHLTEKSGNVILKDFIFNRFILYHYRNWYPTATDVCLVSLWCHPNTLRFSPLLWGCHPLINFRYQKDRIAIFRFISFKRKQVEKRTSELTSVSESWWACNVVSIFVWVCVSSGAIIIRIFTGSNTCWIINK